MHIALRKTIDSPQKSGEQVAKKSVVGILVSYIYMKNGDQDRNIRQIKSYFGYSWPVVAVVAVVYQQSTLWAEEKAAFACR